MLPKNDVEITVLHQELCSGNIQTLQIIWNLSKEQMSPEKLNKLLGQNIQKQTAWHVAAELGNVGLLEKLYEWAKEVLNPDDLIYILFFPKDDNEVIIFIKHRIVAMFRL